MIQRVKKYLDAHPKESELLRYLVAGGLTTLLSFVVFSLFCIAVSPTHTVNGALPAQSTAGNAVSWVIAVLFAFWINRRMVFFRQGGSRADVLKELGQFTLSRIVSFALLEIGLFNLLLTWGVDNFADKLLVLVFVTVFNYVVSKFWIFKAN